MPRAGQRMLLVLFGLNPALYNLLLVLDMSDVGAVGHCR